MKMITTLLLLLGSLNLSAVPSLSEGFKRDFAGEKWEVSSRHEDANGMIFQYVPMGQKRDQWRKKVMVEVFPNGDFTLGEYTAQFHKVMRVEKGRHYGYQMIQDDPNNKIWEWWLADDHDRKRTIGWIRVEKDNKALKTITIQSKDTTNINQQRAQWVNELRGYDFIPKRH